MESVKQRFLRYVVIDTQSDRDAQTTPSTAKQLDLAWLLHDELVSMGASDVLLDEYGYVTATIPASPGAAAPVIGLLAHIDTSAAVSGENVKPVLTPDYDGGDIAMGGGFTLSPTEFPALLRHIGEEIVCTDGSTLLGADDKAGVAEIMTLAERLLEPGAPAHGTIRIGFTPDEEIGRGVDRFDVAAFGADFAYTVDGGALGEINRETFNAADAKIIIRGVSIHPGVARGRMVNAALVCMELHAMLPAFQNPACTSDYEGFYHLEEMDARVERAEIRYIVRDHDCDAFERKKALLQSACDYINEKYGAGTATLTLTDSYYNMLERIDEALIDAARQAMEKVGVEPFVQPIRGGTDGARLSCMGLPCPNICTGGHNFHGRYEFISVQAMERVVDILEALVTSFCK